MAGHSKWSKVKRFKGALDAKRGKIFSRFSKEIMVAARTGGGDLNVNPRLRTAVAAARAQNMPNDTIERAIKKGTGEIAGGVLEELIYEGYGPGSAAIIVEAASDNKNRTAADIRSIFSKNHGHLAASGAVSYLFRRKGLITISRDAVGEERLMDIALEAGAEDLAADEDLYIVTTPQDRLYQVGEAVRNAGIHAESQKLTFLPGTTVNIDQEGLASQVLRLCDALEENDDVQNVYSNFDISDELLTKLSG
ncbi:MAG TPA: YebC/PmpR family DNA-binding transcriptional regulator [Chthoniobacterales bacterium]|jgi:YebC/PmpR family DNA-binding regulatory protein|nr:YebC/PmpR family DNA-binding transcriptional regulator [Chthoniobacterales bacterium]